MRVIAGTLGGRAISTVAGTDVRPTTDRVREAIFNALFSLGGVEGAVVVDAFAGSGALGIEAVSRGASRVVFLDQDERSVRCVRRNLDALGVSDDVEVRRGDAVALLPSTGRTADPVDIVLADPPYDFDSWDHLAHAASAAGASLLVCESGGQLSLPDPWETVREKRYGRTHVIIGRRG